ncbi:MAG: hypothetical protein WDZ91_06805 [Paenibacillaceae bacterium]
MKPATPEKQENLVKKYAMQTMYGRIFDRLDQLTGGIVEFAQGEHQHLKIENMGFMPLSIECIGLNRIAMAHNYIMNGDVVPDPDMEILIHPGTFMAESLTYQDAFGYLEVYANGERTKYYPDRKTKLNSFLDIWTKNIRDQSFIKLAEELRANADGRNETK